MTTLTMENPTEQELYIIEHYARTMTRDIAKHLGISTNLVYQIKRKFKLDKDKNWLVDNGFYKRNKFCTAANYRYKSKVSGELLYSNGKFEIFRAKTGKDKETDIYLIVKNNLLSWTVGDLETAIEKVKIRHIHLESWLSKGVNRARLDGRTKAEDLN